MTAHADRARGRIRIASVSVTLGSGAARVEAVQGVDLSIEGGEFVCLLGPSGCGKSTLLNALAGYVFPTRGNITVDGVKVARPDADRGMVFQRHTLFPWKTVAQNVAFGLKMRGISRKERRDAALRFLDLVGLAGFEDHYPSELSGGMQQRVEIARVLINEPRVVLMDEPFCALDAQTRLGMQELLLDIWTKVRTTVVFVTHDIDEAIFLADRIVVMTRRPGTIKSEIVASLPRPRGTDLVTSADFTALKKHCFDMLREELPQIPSQAISKIQ